MKQRILGGLILVFWFCVFAAFAGWLNVLVALAVLSVICTIPLGLILLIEGRDAW